MQLILWDGNAPAHFLPEEVAPAVPKGMPYCLQRNDVSGFVCTMAQDHPGNIHAAHGLARLLLVWEEVPDNFFDQRV